MTPTTSTSLPPPIRRKQKPRPGRELVIEGDVARVALTQKQVALIDVSDVPLVESYGPWCAQKTTGGEGYYAVSDSIGRRLYLHHLISGVPRADHKNGDRLDCRRDNLRASTASQNGQNRGKNRNNPSGFKGVRKSKNKWRASAWFGGRLTYLGTFTTPEEAARAYDAFTIPLHGEFARPNFPTALAA